MSELSTSFERHKSFALLISIFLICIDIYYNYYGWFTHHGYSYELSNRFIIILHKTGLFNNLITIKIIIIILAALFNILDRGKKNLEESKKNILIFMAFTTINFFVSGYVSELIDSVILYTIYIGISFLYLIKSYSYFSRLLNTDFMKDRFNKKNKIFPQMTEKIENSMSVNIPYKFVDSYKKDKAVYAEGYVNLIAPERATMVLGKPGSGKSYSFIEEIIRQHTIKGFSMINYDYKFPTLTKLSYNYYSRYADSYSDYKNHSFKIINLDDPRYSHRCNPVSSHLLDVKSKAIDAVYTLFYNIDKKSAQKQDFFQMSAMAITSATLWFLKLYDNGRYCTLPHLIEFINRSDEEILKILDNYTELKYFTSSFSDALRKESFEQLSGQTASARIPLGKCATDEMFWVMAPPQDAEQVDLRVNLPENVTVLNIANNPETQKTNAPALGLYMSQAAKLINAQGRVPCDFIVDELPTIFINGLNNLIATARSNKVCTLLALQDYSQLVSEYGKEQADTIFNTIDNIISGKVAIETADKISKAIGKINYKTQSITINKDSTSTSFNTQRELLVPPEDISQFSQGEFVGIVSDNFKQPLDLKRFRGLVSPDKSDLTDFDIKMINPDLTKQDLRAYAKHIEKEVDTIIREELFRIEYEHKAALEEAEGDFQNADDIPDINAAPPSNDVVSDVINVENDEIIKSTIVNDPIEFEPKDLNKIKSIVNSNPEKIIDNTNEKKKNESNDFDFMKNQ